MTRREFASAVATRHAADPEVAVAVLGFADGVVAVLRDREETAFCVLAECEQECDESAIGWSPDRRVWCVVCPTRDGYDAVRCRVAEELHLYDGLDAPLAKAAGVVSRDHREVTLADYATELVGG